MKTISEISTSYKRFRQDQQFIKRRLRWDEDFNLYRMKPYDAGKGYYSYTSNAPKILVSRSLSMIVSSKLHIRIPLDTLRADERVIANNNERLLYGMLNLNDEALTLRNQPSTIEQMGWHALLRGGFAVYPLLYKNEEGKSVIDLRVWDLYTTAFQMGKRGISWATSQRTASRDEVEAEYGVKLKGAENVSVYTHLDDTYYSVSSGDEWLIEPAEHGKKSCPVMVLYVGDQPIVSAEVYNYPNIHRGESVLAHNRSVFPMTNKLISDYATIVHRGVKVPLGYWSAGAEKTLDEDIYQVEKGATVALDSTTNEKIAPLLEPTMPADAKFVLDLMSGEEQRGGLSHLAQGQLGFRLSGFAINQMLANITSVVEPFLIVVEKGLWGSLKSLQEQYATGKFPPLEVRGRDSRQQAFGFPQAQLIKPDEVRAEWRPEFRLIPVLPKDDAQRFQLAHIAISDQLLSLETIQDTLIGIDDPALEREKMSREWGDNLMLNRLSDAYLSYVADGDTVKAENTYMELQRVLQAGAQEAAGRQGGAEKFTPQQQQSMSSPGVGIPPEEVGMSTDVLPPEMLGGLPGGAVSPEGGF